MKVPGRMQEAWKNIVNLFFANLYLTDSLTQFDAFALCFCFCESKNKDTSWKF